MRTVTIAEGLDPSEWETYVVEDHLAFIRQKYPEFPASARIYHEHTDEQHDVTPSNAEEARALAVMEGHFSVVVYPEWAVVPYVVGFVVAAIIAYAVVANLPKLNTSSSQNPSPNNSLTSRSNKARTMSRIPDIYGTVRSVPDLIMNSYTVFDNNVEVEHAYMCVGRGYYQVNDILDDTTPIANIPGARAVVYCPNSWPNTIGPFVPVPGVPADSFGVCYDVGSGQINIVYNVRRLSSVNGQTLFARNDDTAPVTTIHGTRFNTSTNINPHYDSTSGYYVSFASTTYPEIDPTQLDFNEGDAVYFSGGTFFDGEHISFSLAGNQAIDWSTGKGVTSTRIYILGTPFGPNWPLVNTIAGCQYPFSVQKFVPGNAVENQYILPDIDTAEIWLNIVAPNGSFYVDDDGDYHAVDATILVNYTPCDENGNVSGSNYSETFTLNGMSTQEGIGATFKIVLPTPGRYLVSARRIDLLPSGSHVNQVVSAVQWKDLYGVAYVGTGTFGDVTTVYTVTQATKGALSVKDRKLNMEVTRLVKVKQPDGTYSVYGPTNNFVPILLNMILDPLIGGYSDLSLVDVPGLEATNASINAYFGTSNCSEFCYTFDDDNTSFEEMVTELATAVFCVAFRQGNTLKFRFEQATDQPRLMFGHRNKVPQSETRTTTFGAIDDYDCVAYTYTSPADESPQILYAPVTGYNPKKVTGVGVRNYNQAYMQLWRTWGKTAYANCQVEFDALEEANLLVINDCVLVADNTRSGARDGQVIGQNVLELELSQPLTFDIGKSYKIFLQGTDGTTDVVPITPGSSDHSVVLQRAPLVQLCLDPDAAINTLYWIVPTDDPRPQQFLVNRREPSGSYTKVTCINYDARFYEHDDDVKTGTIPSNPDPMAS